MSVPENALAPGPAPERESGPRGVPRQDPRLHGIVTLAIVVIAFVTVRPLDFTGRGLAVAVLLVISTIALTARHLPEPWLPPRAAPSGRPSVSWPPPL